MKGANASSISKWKELGHEWIAVGCFFDSGYICQWYKSWQRIQCYAIMNDLDSLKKEE